MKSLLKSRKQLDRRRFGFSSIKETARWTQEKAQEGIVTVETQLRSLLQLSSTSLPLPAPAATVPPAAQAPALAVPASASPAAPDPPRAQSRSFAFVEKEKVVANTADLSTVMVWDGLTSNGKILLVFVDTGVKINKDIYPKSFLDTVLKPVVHILIWV
ncbi:hypothetical protein Aduo_015991 [Ancylostoma duodenale]